VCSIGSYLNLTSNFCIRCPSNTTNTFQGSTALSDCTVCTNGLYGTGPTGCQACPANSAVPPGTVRPTSLNDCLCKPG
jgi:hypothetical protein